jgi:uncharacterized protein (TIGR03437 family)
MRHWILSLFAAAAATAQGQALFTSVNTFAGIDTSVLTGDGGVAYYSTLNHPQSVARDSSGNLYITETGRIRKIDGAGIISTIAGNGTPDRKGDGGPATAAQVFYPSGIAIDSKRNIYFSEDQVFLRHIAPDGTISTIAKPVQIRPTGLAVDAQGQLYIADSLNHQVRVIRTDGNLYTFAGTGVSGTSGENGPATQAQLLLPTSLAFDRAGSLYIADGQRVLRVDANGILTRVAGNPSLPPNAPDADDVPAVSTSVNAISVAVGAGGDIYVGTPRVRRITLDGLIHAVTLPNDTNAPFTEACGNALHATVYATGLLVGPAGDLDVANPIWNRVQQISAGTISTIAGTGPNQFTGDGGPAANATFAAPSGIAFDNAGNLYIADTNNNRVRRIDTSGNVQTVAGDGGPIYSDDAACITDQDAFLNHPRAVAIDSAGDLYIADTGKNRIRKITPDGTESTVVNVPAPVGVAIDSSGNLRIAGQSQATGSIAFDAIGNLFLPRGHEADRLGTDGSLSPVAGTGEYNTTFAPGFVEPPGEIGYASAVAIDATGSVYVADSARGVVQRVSPACTLASGAPAGNSQPSGLAFDTRGNLYIADAARGVIFQTTPSVPPDGDTPTPIFGYNGIQSMASVPLIQPLGEPPLPAYAGPIAPGELVRVRGICLGPMAPVNPPVDASGKLPVSAAGVAITANGIPVPLISVSSGEILAVAPYGLDGQTSSTWTLNYNGVAANKYVAVQSAVPAILTVLNQDGSTNTQTNPATKGNQAAIFATGLGQTDPPGIDGAIAAAPLPQSKLPVQVTVGGQPADVLYAGSAPGFVGLSQINFVVPPNLPGQSAPITISAGPFTGPQTGIYLWLAK